MIKGRIAALGLAVCLFSGSVVIAQPEEAAEMSANAKWLIGEFDRRMEAEADTATEIARLHALSQYPGILLNDITNREQMTLEDRDELFEGVKHYFTEASEKSTAGLKTIVDQVGWDGLHAIGPYVMGQVFEILIHSEDYAFAEGAIPSLEALARDEFISPYQFALFYDQVKKDLGKPQRYATIHDCVNGVWETGPLEDPENVDKLRQEVGMDTLENYLGGEISLYGSCPEEEN